jgi:hypothetical protein
MLIQSALECHHSSQIRDPSGFFLTGQRGKSRIGLPLANRLGGEIEKRDTSRISTLF